MSDSNQVPDPVNFRAISPRDFAALDGATKDRIVRARHLGVIRASEQKITSQLVEALTNPRQLPDGSVRPPYRHDELVVVLMHRDDPITPAELRASLEAQQLEVGVFVAERGQFAAGISLYDSRQCDKCSQFFTNGMPNCAHCGAPASATTRVMYPYKRAGEVLKKAAPPGTVYITVFDMGMCTVTFIGFDPNNPNAETVAADPNVLPPPAVDPLQKAEPKQLGESKAP